MPPAAADRDTGFTLLFPFPFIFACPTPMATPMQTSGSSALGGMRQAANGMYNYVVTAHKPTSVSGAITGNFTGPEDINLVVSKSTRLEIYTLSPEGIVPLHDVPIYGRIANMRFFRPKNMKKELLFLSTERYKFCILEYDADNRELVTRARGDIQDRIGRPADAGQLVAIDPECTMIGMFLYDGLFKVIPLDNDGKVKEAAFNIRLEEQQVIDVQFLAQCPQTTLAVLYQDTQHKRHVKTYVVKKEKEFGDGPWAQSNVENGASKLLPTPDGDLIVIGEQTISYHTAKGAARISTIPMTPTLICAAGMIDQGRWLLGDHMGTLHLLVRVKESSASGVLETKLHLEVLGQTQVASCIAYLDNGISYIGSESGDSQLIRLADRPIDDSHLEVLESFTNLGPIVDFAVIDLERMGQGQVVTCSGAFKDGSLRIIRSGIGINEQATVDLPGIKGIWGLRPTSASQHDSFLIVSFVGETRVLAMVGEEMEETEIAGFNANAQTLYCGNAVQDQWIQVTSASVRLVRCSDGSLLSEWKPERHITVCSATTSQVVVCVGGGHLCYLELRGNELVEVATKTLEHEIACLHIGSVGTSEDAMTDDLTEDSPATFCAAGLWTDISVRLLRLPTLEQVCSEPLGGDIIPRSVLFVTFEDIVYLLCALGDGHLFSYIFNTASVSLSGKKKISLGTKPVVLSTFKAGNVQHVFASSDRPTVVYSRDKKLLYSNVNLKEVNHVCPFNSASFPESLAIASEDALAIGNIDDIQKLHIRTVPLGEMPRRIAFQEESRTLCVLSVKFEVDQSSGDEVETYFVRLLDSQTLEAYHHIRLESYENVCSVISASFEGSTEKYYIVGTAFALPNEAEPVRGHIHVYEVKDKKLVQVASKEVGGAVYQLREFNGRLLAAINSKVQLFKWQETEDDNFELMMECGHHGHIIALYVKTQGDFIVVGDLMKSISLLVYKPIENAIEEVARDYNPNWMSAVAILDDDVFVGAENWFNLFTLHQNSDAATDEERGRLDVVGEYHVGEFVNVIQKGSLVMRHPEGDAESEDFDVHNAPIHLFGTVSGMLGVIVSLTRDQYERLVKVQKQLVTVINGIGGLDHDEWRSFSNERKTSRSQNFLDGDLIECFLDLARPVQQQIADKVEWDVDRLTRAVEDLQRLH